MTLAPRLVSVAPADLPVYPLGSHDRLDGNSFVKWQTARWLSSRTFKLMPWDMQGMARALFDLCQNENPIGTLPDDDEELAAMLRLTPQAMRGLRALEFGPLRNWQRCMADGAVRLMHPVVLETIQDALERRAIAALSKEQRAVAMRRERLRRALLGQGCAKDVVADDVLITRMDEWIEGAHKGNRTAHVYRSALLHAVQQRWMGREGAGGLD